MLVIIEGCDGAGKTTLTEQLMTLARSQGVIVRQMHKGPPSADAFGEYTTDLRYTTDPSSRELLVCDRWHLGEMVYGPIYRGGSALNAAQLRLVDALLDALGAVKVILDAPDEVLRERAFRSRGETFLQEHDLRRVAEHYRALGRSLDGWRVYDTTNTTGLAGKLLKQARRLERAVTTDA